MAFRIDPRMSSVTRMPLANADTSTPEDPAGCVRHAHGPMLVRPDDRIAKVAGAAAPADPRPY